MQTLRRWQITFGDLTSMSNRCFHTLYYRSFKINEQKEKEEKRSAYDKAKEKGKGSKNNRILTGLSQEDLEDVMDELN